MSFSVLEPEMPLAKHNLGNVMVTRCVVKPSEGEEEMEGTVAIRSTGEGKVGVVQVRDGLGELGGAESLVEGPRKQRKEKPVGSGNKRL